MDTKYKKRLGSWGEKQLDSWLEKNNWIAIEKNLKIRGGEIDRIYCLPKSAEKIKTICIAEIKTNAIFSKKSLMETFTEIGIKKYIKRRQIKNLYRFGENLIAQGNSKILLRIFIVLKIAKKIKIDPNIGKASSIKICYMCDDFWILSIEPEFTNVQARKSLLQIKI